MNEVTSPLPNPPPLRGRGGWGVELMNRFVSVKEGS